MHTKASGGVTTTYTYDGAGRLTSESSATSSISYAYDAANNRTSMVNNGTLTTYTYDANNRMLTETEGGTTKAYTYDANGNQLTGDGATYTYNARGQQTGYSKGGVTASYTYLPTGLRKSKTVGITTTNYVWDGQNMVYEYNSTNSTGGTAYYYGLTLISQGNYAYYLYNAHGDVVQLVSSTGSLGWNYEYDAFGNELTLRESDSNPFRYAGQYYDKETGTYYLRARYYDPSVGRFTQQDGWSYADPSDPLSLNLYTYGCNNPVRYYDPSGHSITAILLALTLASSLLLTGCGRTSFPSTPEEAQRAIGKYLLINQGFDSMDAAAIAAAKYFFDDEEFLGNILKYEYQVNIIKCNEMYYVTKPYTDKEWGSVGFQKILPNNNFVTVATLHTHSHIKEDPESIFSKDKNNLPEYEKYVFETDGEEAHLMFYFREENRTIPKYALGECEHYDTEKILDMYMYN